MELIKKRFGKAKFKEKVLNYKEYAQFVHDNPDCRMKAWDIKKLTDLILSEYVQEILKNPDGVALANSMGEVSITFSEPGNNINHKVKAETGLSVKHLNLSTNGKVGKITWAIGNHVKQNRFLKVMSFTPYTRFSKNAKVEILKHSNKFNNAKVKI